MLDLSKYKCEFCGKPCTNVLFAAFVCDDPVCIQKAHDARGGPGGHMKRRANGQSIVPEDIISEDMIAGKDDYADPNDDRFLKKPWGDGRSRRPVNLIRGR